jgi:hypothetical protein
MSQPVIGDHKVMAASTKNETSAMPSSLRPSSLHIANKKSTNGPMSTAVTNESIDKSPNNNKKTRAMSKSSMNVKQKSNAAVKGMMRSPTTNSNYGTSASISF